MTLTIYASKLFEVVKRHLPDVHAYADDNQLYISLKPGSSASELEAVTALEDCILDIKNWMMADKQNGINCNRNPRAVGQDKYIKDQY